MKFDDHIFSGYMDDLCTHDAAELDQGGPVGLGVGDLHEHHFQKNTFCLLQPADLDHIQLFIQMLFDLVDGPLVPCGDGSSFVPQKSRQLYPH